MLSTYTTESNTEEAYLSEKEEYVFLDSCASSKLLIYVINRVSSHSCIQVDQFKQHKLEYSWRIKDLGNIMIE